jgi:hypothetical protein
MFSQVNPRVNRGYLLALQDPLCTPSPDDSLQAALLCPFKIRNRVRPSTPNQLDHELVSTSHLGKYPRALRTRCFRVAQQMASSNSKRGSNLTILSPRSIILSNVLHILLYIYIDRVYFLAFEILFRLLVTPFLYRPILLKGEFRIMRWHLRLPFQLPPC